MKKNIIIVTGGAGFVGSNLIELLLLKTSYKIISIDNYSSGSKKNHFKNKRVKYIRGHTKDIEKLIKHPKRVNSKTQRITWVNYFISCKQQKPVSRRLKPRGT